MRFCACFTSTSTSFATVVEWRNERQTAAVISFLQCVGFRRGPFVKITTALLYHPASPWLRFPENHLMSVSDSGGGPGNGNWFHIALSSQFLIKCNMFRQHKTIFFFFCSPWSFWLGNFHVFSAIKGTDGEMGKGRGDLNLSSILMVVRS